MRMSDDSLANAPVNLYGPLCKIFCEVTAVALENSVNAWIKDHPNAYLEEQETTHGYKGLIFVTIWYTEDTSE